MESIMVWSSRAVAFVGCLTLVACSGGGVKSGAPSGDASTEAGLAGDGGGLKGPGDTIKEGEEVDLDGDGTADGVAVDTDGDGLADGVDTDGDGIIDEPLPTAGDSGVTGLPFPVDATGTVLCGTGPCACNDGLDNDSDNVTDLADPECVSSWDNDEGSLATGIPGDNRDGACQDCFFDGNSGAGDDGCRLPTSCLTEGNDSSGRGSCSKCEQSDRCKNFCEAYTPNGCDCFGCCDVAVGGTVKHVLLEAGCDINGTKLDNCTECVPSKTCVNECGRCELCPGKTVNDLPADCAPASGGDAGTGGGDGDGGTTNPPPPAYTCDKGETLCGAGLPACAEGSLCQFGCCMLIPIII